MKIDSFIPILKNRSFAPVVQEDTKSTSIKDGFAKTAAHGPGTIKAPWMQPISAKSETAPNPNAKNVDQAMAALGIDPNSKTDLAAIHEVLSEMKLLDFKSSYPPVEKFLREIQTQPQEMGPIISRVRDGLVDNNPAICEFLGVAVEKGWLKPGPEVQSALHTGYVLEGLTAAMANNTEFTKELRTHWMAKRAEYGMDPSSAVSTAWHMLGATGSVFETAKTMSIDPAIVSMIYRGENQGSQISLEQLDKLYDQGQITAIDRMSNRPSHGASLRTGLIVNIEEADITSLKKGERDNALLGFVLEKMVEQQGPSEHAYTEKAVLPEASKTAQPLTTLHAELEADAQTRTNFFPKNEDNAAWVAGYTTWNADFVMSALQDTDFMEPKLFIPSVLCAKPENYISTRALALWASLNRLAFQRLEDQPSFPGPANRQEMAQAWGAINKKHALKLAESELKLSPAEVTAQFEDWSNRPLRHFAKEVKTLLFS